MKSLLPGVSVLDFSEYMARPYCGLLLADPGARVIKVESPDGAEERRLGAAKRRRDITRMSLAFNRGKESPSVDLRQQENRDLGKFQAAGHPTRFLETPAVPGRGAMALGQDTAQILRQSGYGDVDIARLAAAGIVA